MVGRRLEQKAASQPAQAASGPNLILVHSKGVTCQLTVAILSDTYLFLARGTARKCSAAKCYDRLAFEYRGGAHVIGAGASYPYALGGAIFVPCAVHTSQEAHDARLIASISDSARDDFYAKRRDARRKYLPRIIFVPGILGSKIDECRADGNQCSNIWGTAGAVARSNVDLSLRSDRVYRTDFVGDIFFKRVYGGVIDYIREKAEASVPDSAEDPLLTVFAYDWRVSNGDNAVLLKERICAVHAHAISSQIVIIAHSMGGLLTKVWAERYAKEPCADGKPADVAEIVFVATPHLGSPKAINALAEGYNIMFDEPSGFWGHLGYLGRFERDYTLSALNQAGPSFPSLYELLPIRTSEYCLKRKPALAKASIPAIGDDEKPVNLFDIDVWRRYDLLCRTGDTAELL
jgi:Lecithin:cholesterol acyltransferase